LGEEDFRKCYCLEIGWQSLTQTLKPNHLECEFFKPGRGEPQ